MIKGKNNKERIEERKNERKEEVIISISTYRTYEIKNDDPFFHRFFYLFPPPSLLLKAMVTHRQ
jgi:hypothetical protein